MNVLSDNFSIGFRYAIDNMGNSAATKGSDTIKTLCTRVIQPSYNNKFKYVLNSYYTYTLLNQRCIIIISQISLFSGNGESSIS